MDHLLTNITKLYPIPATRYQSGIFTQYSGSYYNKVQASSGCQPKSVLLSSFIAALSFLKPIYIGIMGAVNHLHFNKLWQYNKLINADCQNASFVLIVRCAAGYQER